MSDHKILLVGLVCVDIVNVCQQFPEEDTDTGVLYQEWKRGGNAANNATILSLLGVSCEFLGTIANSYEKEFLLEDFSKYNIDISNCIFYDNHSTPLSIARRGKENAVAIQQMLEKIADHNQKNNASNQILTSIELEKAVPEFSILMNLSDYVIVGKDYSQYHGYSSMEEAIMGFGPKCRPGSALICTWGAQGAMCRHGDGTTHKSPAVPPNKLLDTLGAGDTFTADAITLMVVALTTHKGCSVLQKTNYIGGS
ncbi:KHK [Acanthosepion pharaonis]|uniref:KHK n=1 Tax=Acanthosepion pharaonis TaxID=158019 RepID=A0A812EQK1_ACAPH|nr:KHK [Sepia pharaonis]